MYDRVLNTFLSRHFVMPKKYYIRKIGGKNTSTQSLSTQKLFITKDWRITYYVWRNVKCKKRKYFKN